MSQNPSTTEPMAPGVFSAVDMKRRLAEREAAKAAEELRHLKEQEEKQKAVIEELHKPFDGSEEQLMQRVMQLISHATGNGQSEVEVYRFPNTMCSDRGRRINNSEPGWETSLEGRPKFAYEFWRDHLKPLGYHLTAEVLEYPGGRPGDIGLTLTWK